MDTVSSDDINFSRLKKTTSKKHRYESHRQFLTDCLNGMIVPSGFNIKWTLSLDTNNDEKARVKQLLQDVSFSLMRTGIAVCDRVLEETRDKANILTSKLQSTLNKKTFSSKMRELNMYSLQTQVNLVRQKKRKMKQINSGNNMDTIVPVLKDGNCFFRCVASEMLGDAGRHEEIRAAVVEHMKKNCEYFTQLVDGDFDKHMREMSQSNGEPSTWATEAEIIAASMLYHIDIYVKLHNGYEERWVRFPLVGNEANSGKFLCVNLQNEHFDLIYTSERPSVNEPTDSELTEADTSNITGSSRRKDHATQPEVVMNMSSTVLTEAQTSILSKGLKFVPTRRTVDKGKLIADLDTWERRMRLREYFFEEDDELDDDDDDDEMHNKFKKQSTWTPSPGRDKWLDAYIKAVKDDIMSGLKWRFKMNVSKEEETAIQELLRNDGIVIRPADKGSGVVIMDTAEYVRKLEDGMEDSDTYDAVDNDTTRGVQNKVKKVTDKLYKKGSITKDVKSYITSSDCTSGKLQGNPKLHKPGVPLRAIVNGRNHPTEKMAEVVEDQLRAHVTSLPSYIRDTTDFLNKIKAIPQPLPEGSIIFCLDVKGLYPSVPRLEARDAVRDALNRRPYPDIPLEDVLTMMDTVLTNNTISFNGSHYLQTEGTAIGSHLGMNYASTYMGAWESELFQRSAELPLAYFRFVDDIWGIWTHGEDALHKFHEQANGIHPRIQLELRYSKDRIEFLDTLTSIQEGVLKTDLYTKPTDKHLYLHKESSHPESTKKAIPYGLGVRVKRICTEDSDYQRHRHSIKSHLQQRGYAEKFVEMELKKVDRKEREDLLQLSSCKTGSKRVPLTITFSRALPNIGHILRRHMPLLHTSDRMKKAFQEPPIVAFRRDCNLQDILVHKKHNRQFFRKENICAPCDAERCALCPYMIKASTFQDPVGNTYKVRNNITCKSTNVVYAVFCRKCDAYVYVGETGDTLYQRHLLNLSRMRTRYSDPVADHFNSNGHDASDFRVMGLEKLNGTTDYRRTMERLWKSKLRTYRPYGLNTKE